MNKTKIIAAVLCAGFWTGAAAAADLPTKAPPAAAPSWTGFYLGAQGGAAWGRFAQTNQVSGVSLGYFDQSGALAGGTTGYNWQQGNFVAGLEGDLAWSNLIGQQVCGPARDHACTTEMRAFGTLRGRLGVLVMPSTLIYAAGGLAYADIRATRDSGATVGEDWRAGWTVGGGVETMVAPQLSLKLEYLYSTFPGTATTYTIIATSTPVTAVERDVHMARAGLNWHF